MTKKSLLVAALLGVAVSGTAFAYSPKDSATKPAPRVIPSSVVKPTDLPHYFVGGLLNVEFTLDQTGQPHDVKVLNVGDPALTRRVVAAVSQWRFETAALDPKAGAKRFILPLQLNAEI